jgi:hypothetical protein
MFTTPQHATFDWARAIERNSLALKSIIAALFAMLEEVAAERLPNRLYRAVLSVLRPAESAVRRLIVIATRGLVVKPVPSCPMPKQPIKKGSHSRPSFQLFDPRKHFADSDNSTARYLPRIHTFSYDPRVVAIFAARARGNSAPQQDDGLVNSRRLVRRLQALKAALDNLPHQARRLVRARLRRDKLPSLRFKSPLRPGPPPGFRKKRVHEIDEILAECHWLARDALKVDTS